jgi:hypothetical protein
VRAFFEGDNPELRKALQGAREARLLAPGERRQLPQRCRLVTFDCIKHREIARRQQLDIASAETCSARAAASSLSNHFFGNSRAALGSQTTRLVQAANSPIEPTL